METVLTPILERTGRLPLPLTRARWAVSTLFFLNGALFATWASRIPAVKATLGLNNGELGLALLAMASGAVCAMPAAGLLSARVGSGRVCKISALVYCAILPGLVLAPGLAFFIPALFCFGAAHGALDLAMNAQAVAVEKRYRRPIMSSFHALWSTGGLTGAVVGGLLTEQGLRPLTHFTLVAFLLAGATLVIFPFLETEAKPDGAQSPVFSWPKRGILILGVIALCVMTGEGAMADWSAVYLRNTLGTKESLATAGYAVFSVAMAVGRLLGDRLTERLGAVNLVRSGGTLAALGLATALVCGYAPVALVGFACVGLGFAAIVPILFSAAGHTPGIAPGIALASVTTLGYLGFLIGPPLIGFAAELTGLRWALGLIVATSFTVAAFAPAIAKR